MSDLDLYRKEITEITSEMLQLLERRLALSIEVGNYKKTHDMPVFQADREQALIEQLCQGTYSKEKEKFLRMLFELSKDLQKEVMEK